MILVSQYVPQENRMTNFCSEIGNNDLCISLLRTVNNVALEF